MTIVQMSNASGDMRRVLEACEAALDELVTSRAKATADSASDAANSDDESSLLDATAPAIQSGKYAS